LGLFLNGFPFDKPISELRIPGVLQRIALCYCSAALIFLQTGLRTQVAAVLALLLGYWGVMTLVPVPGIGPGDLSRPNNLAAWIDRGILSGHLYKNDYDPEGLLSTLPAIATTLIGVLAGRWLLTGRTTAEKVAGLFGAGAILSFLGWVWGVWFPVNKALWTSSFVLVTAGLSLQILGLCAWLIEVEGVDRWARPFVVFGSNPIAAFVLSGLGARVLNLVHLSLPSGKEVALKTALYNLAFASWAEPRLASLLFAVAYVLLWFGVMWALYRLKIFIRV
jgi:predicted acyltransferase